MPNAIEIRPLGRDDDRGRFSCGQADLDRFFQHYAGQNQFKLHLAVTYVALLEARIVGFATVAASSIERASVPGARLRGRMPAYPLPVLRLARLGVDTRARGAGIGRALLRHVLGLAVDQEDRFGCVGRFRPTLGRLGSRTRSRTYSTNRCIRMGSENTFLPRLSAASKRTK